MRNLIGFFLILFAGSVYASPVTWTFNDVVLSDGQTLTGSFVYDANTGDYSDVSISNSGDSLYLTNGGESVYEAMEMTNPFNREREFFDTFQVINFFADHGTYSGTSVFFTMRTVDGFFTNDATTMDITGSLYFCSDEFCTYGTGSPYGHPAASIVSGNLQSSVVPVPAAVWLFGSALAGLGWMRRKQAV